MVQKKQQTKNLNTHNSLMVKKQQTKNLNTLNS